jgi:hypothetical protein
MRFLNSIIGSGKHFPGCRRTPLPRRLSRPQVEALEDRTMLSIALINGVLQVTCDSPTELLGGNYVSIEVDFNGNITPAITDQNGNTEYGVFPPFEVNEIYADGCAAGHDHFDIRETLATAPVVVNHAASSGGPGDSAGIATDLNFNGPIQGKVSIFDSNGSISVLVYSETNSYTAYLYTDANPALGVVQGLLPANIYYDYAETSSLRVANEAFSNEPIHMPFARRRIQPTWSTDGHVGRLHAVVRTEKLPMHKAALTVNRTPKVSGRIQQLFSISPSPPGGFGGRTGALPPTSESLANWQTQFFSSRKSLRP